MNHLIKYSVLTLLLSSDLLIKANAATITFDPLNIIVNKNDEFTIDIVGKNFAELAGGDNIGFAFDGSIIEVTAVAINPHFDFEPLSGSRSGKNSWEGMAFDTFENKPASNDFTIATVILKSLETGVSSLQLLDSANYFSTTESLSPTITNAQITVSAVPLPAAWIMMLSAVGLLGGIARKK